MPIINHIQIIIVHLLVYVKLASKAWLPVLWVCWSYRVLRIKGTALIIVIFLFLGGRSGSLKSEDRGVVISKGFHSCFIGYMGEPIKVICGFCTVTLWYLFFVVPSFIYIYIVYRKSWNGWLNMVKMTLH